MAWKTAHQIKTVNKIIMVFENPEAFAKLEKQKKKTPATI